MSGSTEERAERTLILCVDRDDDLGVKGEVKTPVLGREETLNAALNLALRDPEEPDANAIFEAIRIYDSLREKAGSSEKHQVATITGSELGGVEADKKLVSELVNVLEAFPASGVVLVTDGFTDEAVLPLIESRVPVISVRRIVIKHSESIEETAAVVSRYLKMLVEDPRYSRIALGWGGILVVVLGVLSLIKGGLKYAGAAFLIIGGAFLFVKGFGFEEKVRGIYQWVRRYSPPTLSRTITGFSSVLGLLLIGVGCYQGGAYVGAEWDPIVNLILGGPPTELGHWLALLPPLLGYFTSLSITLIAIGVGVLLSGGAIRWLLERDARFWRAIVIIVMVGWSRQIFYEASQILIDPTSSYDGFVAAVIIGITLAVVAALLAFLLHRKYAYFFEGREN